MSKSGLFAHFGSKEELQLATVETGDDAVQRAGDRAGVDAPSGLERLRVLLDGYLRYVEVEQLPGRLLLLVGAGRGRHAARPCS